MIGDFLGKAEVALKQRAAALAAPEHMLPLRSQASVAAAVLCQRVADSIGGPERPYVARLGGCAEASACHIGSTTHVELLAQLGRGLGLTDSLLDAFPAAASKQRTERSSFDNVVIKQLASEFAAQSALPRALVEFSESCESQSIDDVTASCRASVSCRDADPGERDPYIVASRALHSLEEAEAAQTFLDEFVKGALATFQTLCVRHSGTAPPVIVEAPVAGFREIPEPKVAANEALQMKACEVSAAQLKTTKGFTKQGAGRPLPRQNARKAGA